MGLPSNATTAAATLYIIIVTLINYLLFYSFPDVYPLRTHLAAWANGTEDCLHPSTLQSILPYGWGLIVSQARHPAISQYGRLVSQRRVRSHLEARDNLKQAQSRLLGRVTVSIGSLENEVTNCNQ